jgi:hypothetical protein
LKEMPSVCKVSWGSLFLAAFLGSAHPAGARALDGKPEIWLERADGEQDLEQARQDYRKAAEADPQGGVGRKAWMGLGKLEFQAGDFGAAKENFLKAAAIPGQGKEEAEDWAAQAGRNLGPEARSTGKIPDGKDVGTRTAGTPAPQETGGKLLKQKWTVQVGMYTKRKWADAFASKLKKHYRTVRVSQEDKDGSLYFRVCVGRLDSRQEAASLAGRVHEREKIPFVLRQVE